MEALDIQNEINRVIYKLCSAHGNMYAVIKAVLREQGGPDIGGVRKPLANLKEGDMEIVKECVLMIEAAIKKYC